MRYQMFFLVAGLAMFYFGMYQLFFIVSGFVMLYIEFRPNWDVAKKLLSSLKIEEQLAPERRIELRNKILQSNAEMLVIVTSIQRSMIAPVTIIYLAVLFWTFYEFPLSWKAFAFLVPTAGHFFLLWVSGNHRKKVEMHIHKLPPDDQIEVFRLAKLFKAKFGA
jgi:hypothetical protein